MYERKHVSLHEAQRDLWKYRIMLEKNYTENCARWMVERLESLIDHMQYGYALIAYYRQDGTFKFVRATLIPYATFFRREYDVRRVTSAVVYWDVELQGWRNFQLENFLEWRAIN